MWHYSSYETSSLFMIIDTGNQTIHSSSSRIDETLFCDEPIAQIFIDTIFRIRNGNWGIWGQWLKLIESISQVISWLTVIWLHSRASGYGTLQWWMRIMRCYTPAADCKDGEAVKGQWRSGPTRRLLMAASKSRWAIHTRMKHRYDFENGRPFLEFSNSLRKDISLTQSDSHSNNVSRPGP